MERHLERCHVAWTFLRPGFFAQNCQDAYRRDIAEDDRLYVPAGRGRVSFVDVRDVAEVAVRAFQDSSLRNQGLELTGPEAITFQETAALLGEVLGRPIRYVPARVPGYLLHLLRRRGMGLGQAAVQTVLHVGLRFGNGAGVTDTIPRVLGRPARTMATYLRDKRATW